MVVKTSLIIPILILIIYHKLTNNKEASFNLITIKYLIKSKIIIYNNFNN